MPQKSLNIFLHREISDMSSMGNMETNVSVTKCFPTLWRLESDEQLAPSQTWQLALISRHCFALTKLKTAVFWAIIFLFAILFHRRSVATLSLIYRPFYAKWSDEPHSLVPPAQTFTVRAFHTTNTAWNHPHFFHFLFCEKEVTLIQLLP